MKRKGREKKAKDDGIGKPMCFGTHVILIIIHKMFLEFKLE